MSQSPQLLDRLFHMAARGHTRPEPLELPRGFESRVTRQWLAQRADDPGVLFLSLLRRTLAGAWVLVLLSLLINWSSLTRNTHESAFVGSAIRCQLWP